MPLNLNRANDPPHRADHHKQKQISGLQCNQKTQKLVSSETITAGERSNGGGRGIVNPDLEVELKPHAQPRPSRKKKALVKCLEMVELDLESLYYPVVPVNPWSVFRLLPESRRVAFCLATNAVSNDFVEIPVLWSLHTTWLLLVENVLKILKKIIEEIRNKEWGLLAMDEMLFNMFQVHVFPAHTFRKVISLTKSHCKLGLTDIQRQMSKLLVQGIKEASDLAVFLVQRRSRVSDWGASMSYERFDDNWPLLGKVLSAGDDMVGVEQLEEDADDINLHKALNQ
ncbi:hypothetical protein MLD38_013943 [Melastoma candidum]|uniref:Uncharacterized protein n=1 Tax=Melastoma candidum TaxID=119954 RepID=A0ACB9RB66_9MYRT|nr:hypothetical protein MLD38_013943 [Melastoma candidum]